MVLARMIKNGTLPWMITGIVIIAGAITCSAAWRNAAECRAGLKAELLDRQVVMAAERKKAADDVSEKYRADRISYEVMARQAARQQNALKALDARQQ